MRARAIDLLYAPLRHGLLHRHAPLNDQFAQEVIDMGLSAIQPASNRLDR